MPELIGQLVVLLVLIMLGLGMGTFFERRHFKSLREREAGNGPFLITQIKTFPAAAPDGPTPQMIVAEAVVATDYFKSFLAKLPRIFGGEIRSYHSLLVRARREATQRIVEQARQQGYNAICNLRLQTADVGGTGAGKGVAMVAILGSATAYRYQVPTA